MSLTDGSILRRRNSALNQVQAQANGLMCFKYYIEFLLLFYHFDFLLFLAPLILSIILSLQLKRNLTVIKINYCLVRNLSLKSSLSLISLRLPKFTNDMISFQACPRLTLQSLAKKSKNLEKTLNPVCTG